MTDLVLRDIAPDMAARIRRLAEAQGCTSHDVIVEVLDAGVRACEDALRKRLDLEEQAALQHAIAALEGVPDDPGFGLIGRVELPTGQAG
ncbi:MAG: hypothetical protein J0M21_04740 [Xanthomonadales bacterium]|jgi:hypothetical protein|uniref:hypothetical protein n=1 Tax=Thermomonas TaxID=141948 RepID=UPI001ACEA071|nr:hypothetical protein [Thermomonas mangrovi]MBN8263940.1 hypothetical protein [Xanthomonadales bacterium]HMT37309.1 hypothetical protein [Thermomonas sp.]